VRLRLGLLSSTVVGACADSNNVTITVQGGVQTSFQPLVSTEAPSGDRALDGDGDVVAVRASADDGGGEKSQRSRTRRSGGGTENGAVNGDGERVSGDEGRLGIIGGSDGDDIGAGDLEEARMQVMTPVRG